jgi:hypothetical protein
MTREEIGSYLGLKLETVSRTFSKFQDDGMLEVKQRQIRVLENALASTFRARPGRPSADPADRPCANTSISSRPATRKAGHAIHIIRWVRMLLSCCS